MAMKLTDIILIIAATFTALMAGLFFSYSVSVTLGLGKLNDKEFLSAMQHINKEIQNPLFFTCFFGALIMLVIVCISRYNQNSFIFLITATLIYLLGVFVVTAFENVPLNNKLEVFDISNSTEIAVKQMRNIFEKRWNFWNNIRTVFSILSLLLVILACIQENK